MAFRHKAKIESSRDLDVHISQQGNGDWRENEGLHHLDGYFLHGQYENVNILIIGRKVIQVLANATHVVLSDCFPTFTECVYNSHDFLLFYIKDHRDKASQKNLRLDRPF